MKIIYPYTYSHLAYLRLVNLSYIQLFMLSFISKNLADVLLYEKFGVE